MDIKVNVYLGSEKINRSDLHKLQIKNPNIDRIINDIIERTNENPPR